jgi:methionyl-tRNA formyltransferase
MEPDVIIVCGWQQLVGEEILRIPSGGTIGFHSSLLPRYRGRAPVNWALIRGEKKTGVTMFYCDAEADAGDIIAQRSFPILMNDTCGTVYRKAARAVRRLIHEYGPRIVDETAPRIPNDSRNHRCWPERRPEDGRIDWNRGALGTHNWIRALTHPYPGAFTYCRGRKYFVWGSKYVRNGSAAGKPNHGEIVKIRRTNGHKWLQVATVDRPVWVTKITKDDGISKVSFGVGDRFV